MTIGGLPKPWIHLSPAAPWRKQAACLDAPAEVFFTERGYARAGKINPARQAINDYCLGCPVRLECLEEGMVERYGVWGGTTPKERRKLQANAQHNIRLMRSSD